MANADCMSNDEANTGSPILAIRLEECVLMVNPVTGTQALDDTVADEDQTRDSVKDNPELARALARQIEDYGRFLPGYATRPGAGM